ncbi:MAG: hypothetical protein Q3986_08020 [Akkermansia sp.]|nr:hypothetical protein [Akkermansia sp.]
MSEEYEHWEESANCNPGHTHDSPADDGLLGGLMASEDQYKYDADLNIGTELQRIMKDPMLDPEYVKRKKFRIHSVDPHDVTLMLWQRLPKKNRPTIDDLEKSEAVAALCMATNELLRQDVKNIFFIQALAKLLGRLLGVVSTMHMRDTIAAYGHQDDEFVSLNEVCRLSGYSIKHASHCKGYMLDAIASGEITVRRFPNPKTKKLGRPKYRWGDCVRFWQGRTHQGKKAQAAFRAALVEAELEKTRSGIAAASSITRTPAMPSGASGRVHNNEDEN